MRRVATAVVLDVVGSAAVLILLALTWQQVRIDRQPPFAAVSVGLSGRGVAPAVFGAAIVTLAGAVAALATRGRARRLVGLVVVAAGVGGVVSAMLGLRAVVDPRGLAAQALADRTSGAVVPITDGSVTVQVHAVWPVLSAVASLLAIAAGVLFVLPSGETRPSAGLGPRYEAPVAAERPRDATMWSALDHGEDPTLAGADPAPTGHEQLSDAPSEAPGTGPSTQV